MSLSVLKKRTHRKPFVFEEDCSRDSDHHHRRLPQKDEKEPPRMVEKFSSLEREDKSLFTNAKENGMENKGVEEHRTKNSGKEEGDKGATNSAYKTKGYDKFKGGVGNGDVGDEHVDKLNEIKEVHHDVVKQRRKKKEFEVFVGGLDYDTTEEDLREVFSQVGEITELRLSKNPLTKKNKGFAFVHFATVEQARRAVNELKNPMINGKQCGVARSEDKDTLFLANICKDWTKETLKEKLAHYGVDKFEELTLVEDIKNEGKNRGFAFLDFFSREDAIEACKRLQRRDVVFGTDRVAKVAFADPMSEPDEEIMSQVRQVFIDGLPSIWDEEYVKNHLKKFGKIEKVELARNMPTARRADFGFITFDTHDAAMACVNGIDNSELGHGDKKVRVRARLSRPRHRSKSAKHPRGYPVEYNNYQETKDSQGSNILSMDSWKLTSHNGRNISAYNGVHKQSISYRNRNMDVDMFPDTVERRRRLASQDRSFRQRSPGYDTSIHGDYTDEDEYFLGPSDFVNVPLKRQSGKVTYTSRGSGYSDGSRKYAFRDVAGAVVLYDDDNYERYMEKSSSYHDSHIGEYSSLSRSKRPYSAYEQSHSHHGESPISLSGNRYDGGRISFHEQYCASSHRSDSKRMRHDTRSVHDGETWISARNSHGQSAASTSSRSYRKEGISRRESRDGEMLSYTYGRDYSYRELIHSGSDMVSGSYSPAYPSDQRSDGYLIAKRSDTYY